MILPFSQKLNNEPTFFVEKVIKGAESYQYTVTPKFLGPVEVYTFSDRIYNTVAPKLHTIREDKKDRWKKGNKIHPVINNRQKNQLQFAPTMECISVQSFDILTNGIVWEIFIDRRLFVSYNDKLSHCETDPDIRKLTRLAKNDGFNDYRSFLNYFNKTFFGKIIHWTDLKY